jgi:4-amino-4-deoxy-L-arabinose transferase-like glycosyltransferase
VALFLIGIVLRAVGLNGGMWVDEYITVVRSVRLPIGEIVTTFPSNNNHPLFSLLSHLSVMLFGEQPWSLRLPALLFGVVSIPLAFILANQVTDKLEALLATTLFAVSYHHVWFSQNARGYTALLFWTLLCTYLLLRGADGCSRRWDVRYGIAAALGAYTHLTMGVVIAAHALWTAARIRLAPDSTPTSFAKRAAVAFGLAGVLSLLLYLPLVFEVNRFFSAPLSPVGRAATPSWAVGEVVRRIGVGLGTIGAVMVGVPAAIGLASYWRRDRSTTALFVLPPVLVFAGILIMGRPTYPRFFFFALPFAILFVVRGTMIAGETIGNAVRSGKRIGVAIGASATGVFVLASLTAVIADSRYPKQDFEGAIRFIEERRLPGDAVVPLGPLVLVFRDYYRMPWFRSTESGAKPPAAAVQRVWIVHSFRSLVSESTFRTHRYLNEEVCRPMGVFRGTVGDGDLHVCLIENPAGVPRP